MAAQASSALGRMQRRRIKSLWVLGALLLCLVMFIQPSAHDGSSVHELLDDIGFSLIGAAILGRTWCGLYIGGRKLSDLVTDGPYSVTRNPLYVFSCIGAFGIGLATASVVLAFLTGGMVAIVLMSVVRNEEDALSEKFGSAFSDYKRRVPRFWPNPRLWRDAQVLQVNPALVVRSFFESGMMLISIPAIELIEILQHTHIIPAILHLP